MEVADCFEIEIPDGFKIVDRNEISDYYKGFANSFIFQ
jgi:hypothetical protein